MRVTRPDQNLYVCPTCSASTRRGLEEPAPKKCGRPGCPGVHFQQTRVPYAPPLVVREPWMWPIEAAPADPVKLYPVKIEGESDDRGEVWARGYVVDDGTWRKTLVRIVLADAGGWTVRHVRVNGREIMRPALGAGDAPAFDPADVDAGERIEHVDCPSRSTIEVVAHHRSGARRPFGGVAFVRVEAEHP